MLPSALQPEAERILREVKARRLPTFKQLLFIPIRHMPSDLWGSDPTLKDEISEILKSHLEAGDMIALGEACSRPFHLGEEAKIRESLRAKLGKLGVAVGQVPVGPWERAILDLQKELPIRAVGVDSTSGILFATALELRPELIKGDIDRAIRNELLWRLGSEARTRFALNRTAGMAKAGQQVVFIQGNAHLKGIEAWCSRLSVELQTIIPPSLAEDVAKYWGDS